MAPGDSWQEALWSQRVARKGGSARRPYGGAQAVLGGGAGRMGGRRLYGGRRQYMGHRPYMGTRMGGGHMGLQAVWAPVWGPHAGSVRGWVCGRVGLGGWVCGRVGLWEGGWPVRSTQYRTFDGTLYNLFPRDTFSNSKCDTFYLILYVWCTTWCLMLHWWYTVQHM